MLAVGPNPKPGANMSWFEVDRKGLAAILERRGKSFALAELVANAWDSGATRVAVRLTPIEGVPQARLVVDDNGAGFADLKHAYTMFAASSRAGDVGKRGRFNLGEKLVLAICSQMQIRTTSGRLDFEGDKRSFSSDPTEQGTFIDARIRMTRDELAECCQFMRRLLPPVTTVFNGTELMQPEPLARFETKLPTEFVPEDDPEGQLRRTVQKATVEVYEALNEQGEILELGIPVVECDVDFRINVLAKVPLNMERDNVTPAFLKAIRVAVLNQMHSTLSAEQVAAPWVQEAAGDARATAETVKDVVTKQFGERAVVATPNDPLANAKAAANGFTVIPGGAMSGELWSNIKKHQLLTPASVAFPTPKAEQLADMANDKCPLCGK